MTVRKRPYQKTSVTDILLLRERLGLRKYRKTAKRDPQKRELLLKLALEKIEKAEKNNYIPVGFRKRRVNFLSSR